MKFSILAVLFLTCGCSQFMTSPVKDQYLINENIPPQEKLYKMECTKSKAGPVLDTLGVIPVGITALAAFGATVDADTTKQEKFGAGAAALFFTAGTVALIVSAANGYSDANKCRKIEEYIKSTIVVATPPIVIQQKVEEKQPQINVNITNNINKDYTEQ
jgi:hypothetical protein